MDIRRTSAILTTVLLAVVAAPATSALGSTHTVTISAKSSHWTSAHVSVSHGHPLTLDVKGNGTCHKGGSPDCPVGDPNGRGYLCSQNPYSGPQLVGPAGTRVPYGAVAGKVGRNGKPFTVGRHKVVHGNGRLYLIYNDCGGDYGNNAGHFTVTIS